MQPIKNAETQALCVELADMVKRGDTLAASDKTAQAWHGKGSAKEYFAGSMQLAHKGYNLRTALLTKVAGAGLTSFIIGLGYGALLATILGVLCGK